MNYKVFTNKLKTNNIMSKKIFTIITAVLLTVSVFAQSPDKMSYQAVVRDADDNLITSTTVGMQISILQGSETGTEVYVETQTPTTNANGLLSVEIGSGTIISGDFTTIDWSAGPYFIKTETDLTGGASYTITGTSMLLSVPYALYSNESANGTKWTNNGSAIYYNQGNVGIGMTLPLVALHSIEESSAGVNGGSLGSLYSSTQDLSPAIAGFSDNNTSDISYGVLGHSNSTGSIYNMGLFGEGAGGTNNNYGIYGVGMGSAGSNYSISVYGDNAGTASYNYAGYFNGDVHVGGTFSKSAGTFKIDHPLDPANKYLVHSFVESPDMMNIYNGNIVTDAQGMAVVHLPGYFEAENIDFRYQLTVIGEFAHAIVKEKISDNQFVIMTDKAYIEVSWQVTGIRNDAYAQEHRVVPEVDKQGVEKGRYLHPGLYGKSKSEGMPVGVSNR